MSEEIRLPSGQLARLRAGRVEVLPDGGKHYELTVRHREGSKMVARSRDYGELLAFLHQTERLSYELQSLVVDPIE